MSFWEDGDTILQQVEVGTFAAGWAYIHHATRTPIAAHGNEKSMDDCSPLLPAQPRRQQAKKARESRFPRRSLLRRTTTQFMGTAASRTTNPTRAVPAVPAAATTTTTTTTPPPPKEAATASTKRRSLTAPLRCESWPALRGKTLVPTESSRPFTSASAACSQQPKQKTTTCAAPGGDGDLTRTPSGRWVDNLGRALPKVLCRQMDRVTGVIILPESPVHTPVCSSGGAVSPGGGSRNNNKNKNSGGGGGDSSSSSKRRRSLQKALSMISLSSSSSSSSLSSYPSLYSSSGNDAVKNPYAGTDPAWSKSSLALSSSGRTQYERRCRRWIYEHTRTMPEIYSICGKWLVNKSHSQRLAYLCSMT
ncbi:hypothetical protein Micbo1qcDRAFT_204676 [Microdochium bolleyi]|uniref:Uncharacterized protein n=1 Tax=Microdochium bolleyi TaxID=196109 RepID=A0A136J2V3_9PEZI|nr:hypothetical protein Micbo1qcDRAFT_204676 [Microdochium bolleyi]